jgi:UDP-N-acetylglucosamine:LPS N-acetylglucosamine transferase
VTKKRHFLVVLGAGGHTRQMLRLVELLGPDYDYSYVISKNDPVSVDKIAIPGEIFYITQPREKIRGRTDGAFTVLRRMPISVWQAWQILSRSRPDAIFGAGPSLQIPIAIAAKMRGIPHIFIETASKIEFLSFTARLVYRLHLYNRFYVQWESLTEMYPGTRYAGRLL